MIAPQRSLRIRESLIICGVILTVAGLGRPGADVRAGPIAAQENAWTGDRVDELSLSRPLLELPESACPCPKDPPTPRVAIRVRVPACAAIGAELEYRIQVENTSAGAAHHVLVRNPLPAHVQLIKADPEPTARQPELRWSLGTLQPGDRKTIVLTLKPTAEGDLKSCARVQFEHGQCVCTRIGVGATRGRPQMPTIPEDRPKTGVQLRKTGPSEATLHETLSFQLTIANTGTDPLTDVKLSDTLPEGLEHASKKKVLTWDASTIPGGAERTFSYQAIAKKVGKHCNQAAVTTKEGVSDKASKCVTVGEAKLGLAKTGPRQRYLNLPATYLLTVSNPGTIAARNVTIADPVPVSMSFVKADNGGQLVDGAVRWNIGTVEAGASRTVQVVLQAKAAGEVRNAATASADRGLSARAEAVTDFKGVSALLVEVTDTVDPVEVDAEGSYVIAIKNQGMVPATNIQIKALVPREMAVTTVKGPTDGRLGEKMLQGQIVVFDPLKTLAPDATVKYEILFKAQHAGDARFKADITADQLKVGGPVHEEESTAVFTEALPMGARAFRSPKYLCSKQMP
jgi:uncharacterized repeat protein (TIGR01451 family)